MLMKSAEGDIMKVMKNDVIVFWGGTDDVGKNSSDIGFKTHRKLYQRLTYYLRILPLHESKIES
jgi:hypothetical protein